MLVEQQQWTTEGGWTQQASNGKPLEAGLVLYFGSEPMLSEAAAQLRRQYPRARLLGCSTAGEICGTCVADNTVVATAVQFEHTEIRTAFGTLANAAASADVGRRLARELTPDGLVHVFVLAEGLNVNGSELVKGLREALPERVAVTGGLAADGNRFQRTTVRLDDESGAGGVAVVGFYGDRLRVGYGSMGGWDPFGPERLVTRSEGNVLFELDGAPALELYKSYLGSYAADLPGSAMLFPLSFRSEQGEAAVVRTILAVDKTKGSLTFAGDLPQGAATRLMRTNADRLIHGAASAANAARASYQATGTHAPELAVLISGVGRRLVLKQRVEEETETVREALGAQSILSGFYSYGEIAPFAPNVKCELHNQTMTITTFSER